MTEQYLLLGEKVSNSPTPVMMNAAFVHMGLDARYLASDTRASDLGPTISSLRESGAGGANVTIPYKTTIVPFVDVLDAVASRIGAVNTLKISGKRALGYNTDVDGILEPLRSRGVSTIGRAAVLGAGGAARAFFAVTDMLHCREVMVINRNQTRAASFIASMRDAFPGTDIVSVSLDHLRPWDAELFFNASPGGSLGNPLPKEIAAALQNHPIVFDAVYLPNSELVMLGKDMGCRVIPGHEMLLHQGMRALRIWFDVEPPKDVMMSALLGALGVRSS